VDPAHLGAVREQTTLLLLDTVLHFAASAVPLFLKRLRPIGREPQAIQRTRAGERLAAIARGDAILVRAIRLPHHYRLRRRPVCLQ